MRPVLRQALRTLRARPALTLGILLTLALGVGANAAMLGALDALLFRAPAGVRNSRGLARVYLQLQPDTPDKRVAPFLNYLYFAAVRANARTLAGAAAVWDTRVPVGAGVRAELVPARAVSGEFFALLGAAGRPARASATTRTACSS